MDPSIDYKIIGSKPIVNIPTFKNWYPLSGDSCQLLQTQIQYSTIEDTTSYFQLGAEVAKNYEYFKMNEFNYAHGSRYACNGGIYFEEISLSSKTKENQRTIYDIFNVVG